MTQTAPELAPPEVAQPALPTTGLAAIDAAVAALVGQFAEHINDAVDEVYTALSRAYPGLYSDPEAPTTTAVEYRVTETNGHKRVMPPSAAVHAHRLGLRVERRAVTVTEWEEEPNPNTAYRLPISAHPRMRGDGPDDAAREEMESAAVATLPAAGYLADVTPRRPPAEPSPVTSLLGSAVDEEHAAAVMALTGLEPEQYAECTYDERGDLLDGDGELVLVDGRTVSRW